MRKGSKTRLLFAALWFATLSACAPELGDACDNGTDCSVQGDRECDTSAPGGYCTVEDCVEDGCFGEGYCVRFEPDQIRLSSSWCMAKCKRGCRSGYRCIRTADLNAERCGMAVDLFRQLEDLTRDERESLEVGDETGQVLWSRLQDCLAAQPRAAEVLDDKPNAEFCSQEPIETSGELDGERDAAASRTDAGDDADASRADAGDDADASRASSNDAGS